MQLVAVLLVLILMSACGAVAAPSPTLPAAGPAMERGAVRLWQDASIFEAVRSLVASARQRVLVEMYEFGRHDLAALLRAARDRGVDVRLVYDPSVAETLKTVAGLRAAGLPVLAYPLDDRRHQIDHVKLLLTDSTALVGGMNWGAASARNHDYALEMTAPPVIGRLAAVFEQDWARAQGRFEPASAAGEGVVQTAPGSAIRSTLLGLTRAAGQRVDAEVFALTDREVLAALALARRRGARVRVLLDPGEDVNRPSAAALARAGVEVRTYPVPAGAKLHAKAGLFDSELLLGSANWSAGGLEVNHELDVETADAGAVAAFAERFEGDWAAAGSRWWPGG